MSGTPWIKRAYNLGLKAVPNFDALPEEVIEYYERHLDQIPQALARGFVVGQVSDHSTQTIPLLTTIATTTLAAVAGKKTAECFPIGNRYYSRNNFDRWLPVNQPDADACSITAIGFTSGWTLKEAVSIVVGSGVNASFQMLGRELVESGHIVTLPQVEEMIERTVRGENTGVRSNHGNLFFVETGNKSNPVSVGYFSRSDDMLWGTGAARLDDVRRWNFNDSLLIRNLRASKL